MARCNHQVGANPAGDDPLRISKKEECADSPFKENASPESIPEICTENDQHVQPDIETVNEAPITEGDSNVADFLIENHSDYNLGSTVQSEIETRFDQHETLLIKNEGILHDEETRKSNDSIQVTYDDTSTKGSILGSPYVSTVPKEIEILINRLNTTDVTEDITKVRNSVVQNAYVSYFSPDPETGNGAQVIHITDDDTSTKDSLIKYNYDSTAPPEIETGFDQHDTLPIIKGDISSEEETINSYDCIQSTNDDSNIKGSVMESPYVSSVPTEIEIGTSQSILTIETSYDSTAPTEIETGFDQHDTLQIKSVSTPEIRSFIDHDNDFSIPLDLGTGIGEDYTSHVSDQRTNIKIAIVEKYQDSFVRPEKEVRNRHYDISETRNDYTNMQSSIAENGFGAIHLASPETVSDRHQTLPIQVEDTLVDVKSGNYQFDYPYSPVNKRSTSFVPQIEDEVFIPYLLFESPTTEGKDVARPRAKIFAEMKNRKSSFLMEQNNIRHLEPSIRSSCTMDLSQCIARYNMDIGYIQSVIARDLNFFYGDRTKHWKYSSQFLNDEYCVLDQAKKDISDCLASFPFYSAFLKIEAGQSFTGPITIAMSDCPQSRELFDNLRRKERYQTFNACVVIRAYSENGRVEYYPIYSFDWFFKTMWFHDQPPTSEFGICGRTEPITMPNSSWNHQTTHWNQFFIIIYINGKRITLDPTLRGDQLSSVISKLKHI